MVQVKRTEILDRLNENGVPHTEICLGNEVTLIVSQMGGRLYGPFLSPDSESLFWVPPVFKNKDAFASHLLSSWNFGGERYWVVPELQYLVKDRTNYFGTLSVPQAMDPGNWVLERTSENKVRLSQELTLQAYNLASGLKTLLMDVTIIPARNPLRHLSNADELMEGVAYAGYEETLVLKETQTDEIMSAIWNLVMLNPGGQLFIPCTPNAEITCYKGTLDDRVVIRDGHHICFRVTGDQMYKSGLKGSQTFGRMGYLHTRPDGLSYLLVRNFSNHLSAEYPDEPPDLPGRRGDAIFVYNDDGGFGDMGEMELNGQTIGGSSGRCESVDNLSLSLYAGPLERLNRIVAELLGVVR